MIVANVAVALSPSLRASRYGRSSSPARAGSSEEAANPMIVVLSAGAEAHVADGPQQVLPAGRAETVGQARDDQRGHQQIDARARDLGADLTEVGVAKEQGQQARGRHDRDDRTQVLSHAARNDVDARTPPPPEAGLRLDRRLRPGRL